MILFVLNVVASMAALVVSAFGFPETAARAAHLSTMLFVAFLAAFVGVLLLGFVRSQTR
ncbi:MAG: DUF1328 domain-containing protein [Candidatus Omnitrophica bacterium]|nr:DUF1328 domain-containing protein [Candidatus Omnitrophota bacterium]